jgi:choline dehydrogenase
MRSGIGPADHLRRVGVPVLIDLPCVGENLADHPAVSIDSGYRRTGVGQAQLHTLATFRSSHARADQPPDLSFWVADPSGDPAESEIDILLLTPASRGAVRLRSANPADPPLIRLPCLDGDRDVERLAEGLLRARQLRSHRAMHRVCEAVPPPEDQTAADVRNWIRHERYSIPHTVGTCAMGDSSDLTAVVDRLGGVLCVDGVSIIDASIIPAPPSGFPHLLTIMLAERLAAELLARL